jgi:hypothetical protein
MAHFLQLVWHICVIGLKERLNTTNDDPGPGMIARDGIYCSLD